MNARFYDLYAAGRFVGSVWADEVRTMPMVPNDPYCKVFGTRFMQDGLTVTTVWSDGLDWRAA